MTQVNVRVDVERKRQAEEVLGLTGRSITKLMREVIDKVARGAKDAEEVYQALADTPAVETPSTRSKSAQLIERVDSHYAEMSRLLGKDVREFVPLSDDEMADALYDEGLAKEAERMVWHA